jgi:phosphoribosylformylglycinamidine (FGAM) synthase PurS component
MAQSTEQLEEASDDFFDRFVAVLQEMKDVRQGTSQLMTFDATNEDHPRDEIRQIVALLFTNQTIRRLLFPTVLHVYGD